MTLPKAGRRWWPPLSDSADTAQLKLIATETGGRASQGNPHLEKYTNQACRDRKARASDAAEGDVTGGNGDDEGGCGGDGGGNGGDKGSSA